MDRCEKKSTDVTVHSSEVGGKCACLHSAPLPNSSRGGSEELVMVPVRVAETTYIHLSTYDDPLRTDNDDSRRGKLLNYKAPGEDTVPSVGDVSSMSVPEISINEKIAKTRGILVRRRGALASLKHVGVIGTTGG